MERNSRIELTDTSMDVVVKMAGGNPGAVTVLVNIIKESPKIDPQGAMGGMGPILYLDSFGIYEERIWMLYKDVCGQDMTKMLGCLRACQLGFISESQLTQAIDGKKNAFDVEPAINQVRERLSEFGKVEENITSGT